MRFRSFTNLSSSRKYLAKDALRKRSPSTASKANDEHVVVKGAAVGLVGMLSLKAADSARAAIAAVEAELQSATAAAATDSRDAFRQVDVASFKGAAIDEITSRLADSSLAARAAAGRLTPALFESKLRSVMPERKQNAAERAPLSPPQVDHISVELDRSRGAVDGFFTRIRFSLPRDAVSDGTLRAVRIFRAESPIAIRGMLSVHAVDRISSLKSRSSVKNGDVASLVETRLREGGVKNAITELTPIDPFQNVRVGSERDGAGFNARSLPVVGGIFGSSVSNSQLEPFIAPDALRSVDRSVADDPLFLRAVQRRLPSLVPKAPSALAGVGSLSLVGARGIGIEHAKQSLLVGKQSLIVNENNSQGFREIAFLEPGGVGGKLESLRGRVVGDYIEYTFDDEGVSFGREYSYYLASVGSDMKESVRSRIVKVSIDGLRLPPCPKSTIAHAIDGIVSLVIVAGDQLTEKFEIYRRDIDVPVFLDESIGVVIASSKDGFVSALGTRKRQANGYVQVGEVLSSTNGGSTFRDRAVIRGRRYRYRVYAVDIFGNKSECPSEVEAFVNDPSNRIVDLKKPTILVEVDAATNKARVTFGVDDDRAVAFLLKRRDLTTHQTAYVNPYQPAALKVGNRLRALSTKTLEDTILRDRDISTAWTGYFRRSGTLQVFVDPSTQIDHTYQYQVHAIDSFGNLSPPEFSSVVFMQRRPLVGTPINLSSSLSISNDGRLLGVMLSWQDGNLDISAEDRLGNREDLTNTSTRTLFQVQRKRSGEERWEEFSLVEGTSFFDGINDGKTIAPQHRPAYLERGNEYAYRVQAFQTGSYISNYSMPLLVHVDAPLIAPQNLRILVPDTKTRPFYVMINWDTHETSGVVDRWEIERAEVNNVAAARLNSKNPLGFKKLRFAPHRMVYREASRFSSKELDDGGRRDNVLIVGQHHFMDAKVSFGNSYFYRIRAVSAAGDRSEWVLKGISVSDDLFDAKQSALLTNAEKKKLSTSLLPARLRSDLLAASIEKTSSSTSLLPRFASPIPQIVPTTSISISGRRFISAQGISDDGSAPSPSDLFSRLRQG